MKHFIHRSIYVLIALIFSLTLTHTVKADPVPNSSNPQVVIPRVFCFRITDIERVPGDVEGDAFNFEFEVLNWTATPASGLFIATTIGTTAVDASIPIMALAGIDPDGRGGPIGGADIAGDIGVGGTFDPTAIHSGRGRGAASWLAWLYLEENELHKALETVERAKQYQEPGAHLLDTLGWIYYQMGDYQPALKTLQSAVEASGGFPAVHYHLAHIYFKDGQFTQAKQAVETALQSGEAFRDRADAEALKKQIEVKLNRN